MLSILVSSWVKCFSLLKSYTGHRQCTDSAQIGSDLEAKDQGSLLPNSST